MTPKTNGEFKSNRKGYGKLWIALLVIAGAAVGGWFAFQGQEPLKVSVGTVEKGAVEETVTGTSAGTVRPVKESTISAELASRITQILFKEGDAVEAGKELVKFDTSSLDAELAVVTAGIDTAGFQIEQTYARLELSRSDLAKGEQLLKDNVISAQRFEELATATTIADKDLSISKSNLDRLKAQRQELETRISKATVKAPFAGTIKRKHVEVGEIAMPSTPLLEIMDISTLQIEVPIDEIDAPRIKNGLEARLTIDAFKGVTFKGVVSYVPPFVESLREQNRTLTSKIDIVEDGRNFKVGMSVNVEIVISSKPDVVFVPTNVIRENFEKKEKFVFTAEGGRLKRVVVRTGVRNWDKTEVLEGLRPGDTVITRTGDVSQEELVDGRPLIYEAPDPKP